MKFREVLKIIFISTQVKSFVLVLSLSLFVYRESVHIPAKKKKISDLSLSQACLEKGLQYEAETLPEAEKNQAERKRSRITLFANRAVCRKNLMSG